MLGLEDHVEGEERIADQEGVEQPLLPRGECLVPCPKGRPDAECPGHAGSLGISRAVTHGYRGPVEYVGCQLTESEE